MSQKLKYQKNNKKFMIGENITIIWKLFSIKIEQVFFLTLVSICTAILCQLGDLFFSYLKRKAKIKDTGKLFPGHGGILDRLDGILLGVPGGFFITFILQYINII